MNDYRYETTHINDVSEKNSADFRILVLGVGGGGCNALQHAIDEGIKQVEFVAVNTDVQSLNNSTAHLKVQIGVKETGGLGAGCDPNKGLQAAMESYDDLKKILSGANIVFITAGMGGGTGTGAVPVIAKIAHDLGALTVAVVTRPFKFEGKHHIMNADAGIAELAKNIDSLVVVDNNKLLKNLSAGTSIITAFKACDDILYHAVAGITDFIVTPGFINVDLNDVDTVMRGRGYSMIGIGRGKGSECVSEAIEQAILSPLVDPVALSTAAGLLANVRMSSQMSISLYNEVCEQLQSYANEEADCKFGLILDENMAADELEVTVLITGVELEQKQDGVRQGSNMWSKENLHTTNELNSRQETQSSTNLFSKAYVKSQDNHQNVYVSAGNSQQTHMEQDPRYPLYGRAKENSSQGFFAKSQQMSGYQNNSDNYKVQRDPYDRSMQDNNRSFGHNYNPNGYAGNVQFGAYQGQNYYQNQNQARNYDVRTQNTQMNPYVRNQNGLEQKQFNQAQGVYNQNHQYSQNQVNNSDNYQNNISDNLRFSNQNLPQNITHDPQMELKNKYNKEFDSMRAEPMIESDLELPPILNRNLK